ncbi:MAG: pilus assembly FimT family protein [Armatimonadota bacterium]
MQTVLRRNHAFTLIELIVVLFFMVLAASVVAPRMPVLLESMALRDAVRDVSTLIRQARELAVLREEPIAVRYNESVGFTLERAEIETELVAETASTATEEEEQSKPSIPTTVVGVPEGVTVTLQVEETENPSILPSESGELVFTPDGRCPNARVLFTTRRGTGGLTIRVDKNGANVSVEGELEEV